MSQGPRGDEKKGIIDKPLVSIITPLFNSIRFLEPCLQSVLNQSYPYIEHILIDGGSTDGTLDILTSYQARHPDRIRFISERDQGPEDAWNKGLRMAKGGILGWLGADDIYEPDAIQTVVEFFTSNSGAYFVFGDCDIINEEGEVIGKAPTKDFDLDEAINDKCRIGALNSFYRREVIEKVGLIDTTTRISELDYWIRVGKVFQIHRIKKTLASFRWYEGSFSQSPESRRMYAIDGFIISRRYGGRLFSPRGRRYLIHKYVVFLWAASILRFISPRPIWNFMRKLVINE